MSPQLSQLASQVPGVLTQVSKRQRDTLDLSEFFDFHSFYKGDEPSSPGTRSRSEASSDPGLTSGPSEEDGAPSPGPTYDYYHKEDIKQAKQQDDRFTVPEREIRPKGGLPYPSKIHLDNVPSPSGSSPTGNHVMILSNPGSPTMLLDTSVEDSHSLNRGRRTGPLDKPEKVAAMRKRGACYRCKARKVSCDEQAPCLNCIKEAEKFQYTNCHMLAEHMCLRQQPTTAFGEISRIICAEMPPRGKRSASSRLNIFFNPYNPNSAPLVVNVERVIYDGPSQHFGIRGTQYQLSTDGFSLNQDMLIQWASSQMKMEDDSFQSALDKLVIYCRGQDFLPHSDLLQKVHKLRCLYKVWSQNNFVCQKESDRNLEALPQEIHRVLRAMAAKLIKGIESDVLIEFAGKRPKSQTDRWLLWSKSVWLTARQDLEIYEDVLPKAENLMNYAVMWCHSHTGKKKLASPIEYGSYLSSYFEKAERLQMRFFMEVRQQDCPSDELLIALLAKSSKGSKGSAPPPPKRQRKSA
ncbi:hypothetical protein GGR51DRAFT_558359 [Nemania sp. FL0031]|nr:hypothetical protein GGR51DRAFT_558359 [Nemania sp. FL0031]